MRAAALVALAFGALLMLLRSVAGSETQTSDKADVEYVVLRCEEPCDGYGVQDIEAAFGATYVGRVANLKEYHLFSAPYLGSAPKHKSNRARGAATTTLHDRMVSVFGTEIDTETTKTTRKRSVDDNDAMAMYVVSERQVARRLHARGGVSEATVADPLIGVQWHLEVIDAPRAWMAGSQGEGVTISVVDDGVDHEHRDIAENFDARRSRDYNRNGPLPLPTASNDHGTSAAGVAAAVWRNGVCGAGVAPRAKLAGIRLIADPVVDAIEAMGLTHGDADVVSCSWGPTDDGTRLEGPGPLARLAMAEAVKTGRGGLGTIYVWAAGNGARQKDNCNYDGYANSWQTIAVGAVDSTGARAWYSEPCAALMTVAPSSGAAHGQNRFVATTDLSGTRGSSIGDCTLSFGGTSAAAPMVAGVAALVLGTNPRLSWRDVQHIVVAASALTPAQRRAYRATTPVRVRLMTSSSSATEEWRSVSHTHELGFGVINASAAVDLARRWIPGGVGRSVTIETPEPKKCTQSAPCVITLVRPASATAIGQIQAAATTAVIPCEGCVLDAKCSNPIVEWVEVSVWTAANTGTGYRGQLTIDLVAPSGTTARLAEPHDDRARNFAGWTFSSVRSWGESPYGTWSLTLSGPATVSQWSLAVHVWCPPPPHPPTLNNTPTPSE